MSYCLLTRKKKSTKKIAEESRDGGIKKYTNKTDRDNNRQDVSLHALSWKPCCLKRSCILSVVPTSLVSVLFDPAIPTFFFLRLVNYTITSVGLYS